jgi:hypothetical protein
VDALRGKYATVTCVTSSEIGGDHVGRQQATGQDGTPSIPI